MKKTLLFFLKILVAFLALTALTLIALVLLDDWQTDYLNFESRPSAEGNSYILEEAHLIPMHQDTVLRDKCLLIEDGKIVEISDTIIDSELPRLNLHHQYVMPGLNDMHVHLWDRYELGLYLANGVTGIRNVWGFPMHLKIKEDIAQGELIAPSFTTSGPKLTGRAFIGDDNLQLFSPEEARQKVREYHERHYDFIKTYYGLDADLFAAIIDECRRLNMDIVAHPSDKVPYNYHLQEPIISLEHVEDIVQRALHYKLDTATFQTLLQDFKAHPSTSFCPTVMAYYNIYRMIMEPELLEEDEVSDMNSLIRRTDSRGQFERWQGQKQEEPELAQRILAQHQFQLYILGELQKAGLNIICGTDAGIGITRPGFSIHQELAFYKQAGLSNFEVLKTATVNVAQSHEILSDLGSIEPNKRANLLVLADNPLQNLETLKEPQMVFVEGHLLQENDLREFKRRSKGRSNLIATAYHYLIYLLVEK